MWKLKLASLKLGTIRQRFLEGKLLTWSMNFVGTNEVTQIRRKLLKEKKEGWLIFLCPCLRTRRLQEDLDLANSKVKRIEK